MSDNKQYYIYLCGPITGLSYEECVAYYTAVGELLPSWLTPISPMRGKGYLKGEANLTDNYNGTTLSTGQAIVARDFNDVRRADVILANFIGAKRVSIGSVFELAWAYEMQKPVVLAMEDGNVHDHAFVRQACAFRTKSLEEAVDVAKHVVSTGL
jgi:nucleoside 2-deoxyribosyltransferase